MTVAIEETGAKEVASPDTVAITAVDGDADAAEVWTVVGRSDGGCKPESEEKGVDCKLRPSVPGKQMGFVLWARGHDEVDDDW